MDGRQLRNTANYVAENPKNLRSVASEKSPNSVPPSQGFGRLYLWLAKECRSRDELTIRRTALGCIGKMPKALMCGNVLRASAANWERPHMFTDMPQLRYWR
jgi:hypothetical protein